MQETTKETFKLPYAFAKQHKVLVTDLLEKEVIIAALNFPDIDIYAELQRFFAKKLTVNIISVDEFNALLAENYQQAEEKTQAVAKAVSDELDLSQMFEELVETQDLLDSNADAPIIRLLNNVFSSAIQKKASDIHIETFEEQLMIRFRVDGVLHEFITLARKMAAMVVSRIKVLAKLDIAEKRLPQDGRILLSIAGRPVDVRVSTIPASHGERVALRILDKGVAKLDLSHLGMLPEPLAHARELIKRPHGIVLITGPTGAGKTTTLYAMLTELNQSTRNILTVEDPIEFDLPGIGQMQVNPKVDMTFAKGLRAILRQDPDVVMVGEIRDDETAEIAIQASLTGHLVLSTLHTNTAIGAITRLRDIGVEPFLLSTSLVGVAAQRLVRVLCEHCKAPKAITSLEQGLLQSANLALPEKLYHPVGCAICNNAGFKGRLGIYEVIPVDSHLQHMIHDNEKESNLSNYSYQKFDSIREDGFKKVINGLTTLEEVMRVCKEE